MYIFDGFVYGGEPEAPMRIKEVRPMPDRIMILAFENGEYRLFDSSILKGPAFEPLSQPDIYNHPVIDHGVVTWNDGQIDCSPEFMYEHSYEYEPALK